MEGGLVRHSRGLVAETYNSRLLYWLTTVKRSAVLLGCSGVEDLPEVREIFMMKQGGTRGHKIELCFAIRYDPPNQMNQI